MIAQSVAAFNARRLLLATTVETFYIADAATVADVQVAKLRIDARKWTAARFNKAYKDKRDVDVNVSGYVDHSKMDSDQLDRRIAELQDQIEQSETD